MKEEQSILFLGATGAVGSEALGHLLGLSSVSNVLLLGRREISEYVSHPRVKQQIVDIHAPSSYTDFINNHTTAICTLGVGEPSKISKEEFIAIDKVAVINFAKACKAGGVKHFQLLSSVGISASSSNFYLRTKGELMEALFELNFERISIFQPSMIITPNNRYGFAQWLTLKVWPKLNFLLAGKLRKYRGIKVELLGKAIANNILTSNEGIEIVQYDQFLELCNR